MAPHSDDEDHELAVYGEPSSSTRPLLNDPHNRSPPPSHYKPHPRRLLKTVIFISIPFLLVFIYSLIHPHVRGLPPLPRISITSGGAVSQPDYEDKITQDCLCGATDEGERICSLYHEEGLRNTRLVQGSGSRMRRVLQKAREGKKLNIGVLGGSVTACHGVHPSATYPQGDPAGPGCWTTIFIEWVRKTFPDADHQFKNGAIGGMDSSFYAFCGAHHIPEDTDLVILEFDVNDQNDPLYEAFFDQLLRALSEFPSEPAILVLGAWCPQVAHDQGYGDPQIVHSPIALYYDVPYVSMKRLMFQHYMRYPLSTAKAFWQPDMVHPNARGHRVLADTLISYLESELCMLTRYGLPVVPPIEDTIASTNPFSSLVDVPFALDTLHLVDPVTPPEGWEETFDLAPLQKLRDERRLFVVPSSPYAIPPVGVFTPLREVVDPHKPDPASGAHIEGLRQPQLFCADANDKKNPMTPTVADGWEPFVWNGEKHYWVADKPGARIRVEIKVNAGRVAVYYFRSQHYNLGDAKCWVDDNEEGGVLLHGYWTRQYNVAIVAYIDEKVTPGDHYVTCEVANTTHHPTNSDAHHFRLTAVMAT
ncbi:hypothetical protein L202_06166 [Cryptococcus amylolentus CBS 6039]|uniref:SGNH hydrolase-type esterase domain-containing protein n=2 Tax=Cryptococcus amylolentus TaxID=104669 RepID=A0A1E3HIS6_9TREE|nr:hypothetical protein L202_06166 [Cryptococcus amylolentus CBS 6039]ODN76243.1 hypothetical protein L202_06166 [Cryptococcus amylolentus CBS 6039]ODN96282.1 hypothetical protein I350_08296 [Cryptococcus amylolentus CBS 6273]